MDNKKDTEISFGSQDFKNNLVFKVFQKDSQLLFVYKKLERIVSAFYLVSNLLHDNEPIKWQFRDIGIGAVSRTLSLTLDTLSKSEGTLKFTKDLVLLLSLLEITYVGGLISEMNFTLLKKELEHLLEILNPKDFSQSAQTGRKALSDKDFFAVPPDELDPTTVWPDASRLSADAYKRQTKGQKSLKDKSPLAASNSGGRLAGDRSGAVNRQNLIIGTLKTKDKLTIRDFASIIKGCSAKTIQRELLGLVRVGVLKKEGERRWSRYSLSRV